MRWAAGLILLAWGSLPDPIRAQENPPPAPATLTWQVQFTPAANMPAGSQAPSAALLPNGNVLVTGGLSRFLSLPIANNLARIYNPQTNAWSIPEGILKTGRFLHASLTLPDGRVLLVGGDGQDARPLNSIELFNPQKNSFQTLATMSVPRRNPRLNLLPNGAVLITGESKIAELLIPDSAAPNGFILRNAKHPAHDFHQDHVSVTLADDTVLLVGGRTRTLERFYPASETFTRLSAKLPAVLDDQAAARLYNNTILLAGGQEVFSNQCIANTWIYDPAKDRLFDGPKLTPTSQGAVQPGASDMIAVDLFAGDPDRKGRFILLCGGEYDPGKGPDPDIVLDTAQIYLAEENRLASVGPMLTPHDDFQAVLLQSPPGQAKVLLLSGIKQGDRVTPRCEIFSFLSP